MTFFSLILRLANYRVWKYVYLVYQLRFVNYKYCKLQQVALASLSLILQLFLLQSYKISGAGRQFE